MGEGSMVGYMAEANTYFAPGSDLHELKTFLSARLLWNISRVPNDEIVFFLKSYYGEGATSVKLCKCSNSLCTFFRSLKDAAAQTWTRWWAAWLRRVSAEPTAGSRSQCVHAHAIVGWF